MPVTLTCQQCGKSFKVKPKRADKAKYCTPRCYQTSKRVPRPPEQELREVFRRLDRDAKATAEHFGVHFNTIYRWKRHYGIEGVGRGKRPVIKRPPRDELRRLYVDEGLSSRAIGKLYECSHRPVLRWLKEYSIQPNDSKFSLKQRGKRIPPNDVLCILYYEMGYPMHAIGDFYGVSGGAVQNWMSNRNFPTRGLGFGADHSAIADDGTEVASFYELAVANWLFDNDVEYVHEPDLPFDTRHRADFLIGSIYVEVWGLAGNARYDKRRKRKERLYSEYDVPLVGLTREHFRRPYAFKEILREVVNTAGVPQQKQLELF